MNEIWIPAFRLDGYEVSNLGNIRSVDRNEINSLGIARKLKGKTIRQQVSARGYINVTIRGKTVRAHRLIAMSFFGDSKGMEVNHKNGVRADNRIENLEFCTRSENQKHAVHELGNKPYQPWKGRFGSQNPWSKPVFSINVKTGEKQTFDGMHEAQRITGLDKSNISAACRGKQKTCGGYIWGYV